MLPPCRNQDCPRPVEVGRGFCCDRCAAEYLAWREQSDHYHYCWVCQAWAHGDDACEHATYGTGEVYTPEA